MNIDSVPMPEPTPLDIETMQPGDVFIIRGSRYTFTGYTFTGYIPGIVEGTVRIGGRDTKGEFWMFAPTIDIDRIIPKAQYKPRKRSLYPLKLTHGMFTSDLAKSEDNDCTVVALAIAAELSYDDAHHIMQTQAGRKAKKGSNISRLAKSIMWGTGTVINGYRVKWHGCKKDYSGQRTKGTTLRQLLASGVLPKRCIISIAQHAMACIDGVVYDTFHAGARSVVEGYYSFEKEESK